MKSPHNSLTLLDCGRLPVADLARIAMREGVRPRAVYQAHKWFARRLAITARSLLVAAASDHRADFWSEYYKGGAWTGRTVLDPFVGGGVMLLEATRLGANVQGVDIEPVAAAIANFQTTLRNLPDLTKTLSELERSVGRKLARYYEAADGETLLHAFWVQTVECGRCETVYDAHPSLRFAWDEATSRQWVACAHCSAVLEGELSAEALDCTCGRTTIVSDGPVVAGEACCPSCGHREKLIAFARRTGSHPTFRLFAVETLASDERRVTITRRRIRTATAFDRQTYDRAAAHLARVLKRRPRHLPIGRIPLKGRSDNRLVDYGYQDYSELFNARQKLHLALLGQAIAKLPDGVRDAFAIAFSDHLTTNNMMCGYAGGWRRLTPLFSIRAYRHIGRPVELNPWLRNNGRGTFPNAVRAVVRASNALKTPIEPTVDGAFRSVPDAVPGSSMVLCGDARNLAHIDAGTVDLVLTDPPYFDYISYSELGHFFTPWFSKFGLIDAKRAQGFPAAQLASRARSIAAEQRFADRLGAAFKEIRRVCKDDGRVVFTYQNLDGRGWAAICKAMARAGVIPFQTFPLYGDSSASLHKHSQSISWDCVMVCRLGEPVRALRISQRDRDSGLRAAVAWRGELEAKDLAMSSGDATNVAHAASIVAAFARRCARNQTGREATLSRFATG